MTNVEAGAIEPGSERAHPGAREYLGVATVLTVLTALEVTTYYVRSMRPVLVPVLLTLSVLKFGLVVLFYMHLKFDSRLFSWLFVIPLCVAGIVVIALLGLFGRF
jgi:cytochrome c oxidase subunit 4